MYRRVSFGAAVLLLVTLQSAAADDRIVCEEPYKRAEAVAACDRLLARNPEDAKAYYHRGNAYYFRNDYKRAIADFNQAIRRAPASEMYTARAMIYDRQGDWERAFADYSRAIQLDPDANSFPYAVRGTIYRIYKGDYDRAIADFNQAMRLEPTDGRNFLDRGQAFEDKGDLSRALADFDEALRLEQTGGDDGRNPTVANARAGRERVQAKLARRADAVAPANPATAANPAMAANPAAAANPAGVSGTAAAPQERRIALVIGMSAYGNVAPLSNPAKDAHAVAATFRRLGFAEVIEREDLTRAALEGVLKEFGDKADGADWSIVYYAGHGVEINGENYLVPVDAKLARPEHVEDEAVALKRVLSKTAGAHKLRLVILDACRNSPFRTAPASGGSRGVGRGLSPVEPARGVLVAYAARDGTTADDADADSDHSPFTQALLTNLETPGIDIGLMFRRVRDQVLLRTNNAQEPFTYGSLPGEELYFKGR